MRKSRMKTIATGSTRVAMYAHAQVCVRKYVLCTSPRDPTSRPHHYNTDVPPSPCNHVVYLDFVIRRTPFRLVGMRHIVSQQVGIRGFSVYTTRFFSSDTHRRLTKSRENRARQSQSRDYLVRRTRRA